MLRRYSCRLMPLPIPCPRWDTELGGGVGTGWGRPSVFVANRSHPIVVLSLVRRGSAAGTIISAGLEGSGESDGGVVGATGVRNDDPTRHLGWRLEEVVREIPGPGYSSAAQGIRRFWSQGPKDPEKEGLSTCPSVTGQDRTPLAPAVAIGPELRNNAFPVCLTSGSQP